MAVVGEGGGGEVETTGAALAAAAAAAAAGEGEGGGLVGEGEGQQQQQQQQLPPLDAPHHWPAEHQERFGKADREWQQWFLDRDKDMTAAHTRRSQEVAPLRQALERWGPALQQMNTHPMMLLEQAVPMLHTLLAGTNEQKANLLLSLARDYGVNFGGPPEPTAEEDPFGFQKMLNSALNNRLGPVEQALQRLGGGLQGMHGQHQATQEAGAMRAIEEFRGATGDGGKPAHPYFDEVASDLLAMAQARSASGQPLDLAQMYEAACWANPPVRAKLQLAERTKATAEQERARKAARASGGLEGGGGGGGPEGQPKSTRDALKAAFAEHSAA